jgi:hypothetical protein
LDVPGQAFKDLGSVFVLIETRRELDSGLFLAGFVADLLHERMAARKAHRWSACRLTLLLDLRIPLIVAVWRGKLEVRDEFSA